MSAEPVRAQAAAPLQLCSPSSKGAASTLHTSIAMRRTASPGHDLPPEAKRRRKEPEELQGAEDESSEASSSESEGSDVSRHAASDSIVQAMMNHTAKQLVSRLRSMPRQEAKAKATKLFKQLRRRMVKLGTGHPQLDDTSTDLLRFWCKDSLKLDLPVITPDLYQPLEDENMGLVAKALVSKLSSMTPQEAKEKATKLFKQLRTRMVKLGTGHPDLDDTSVELLRFWCNANFDLDLPAITPDLYQPTA